MKIALLCGGPSLERGISLNSARSVLDHLEGDGVEIIPYYFDSRKRTYKISKSQLYSNTPSDFDFKLHETAKPLMENELVAELYKCDLAFPAMHGQYGEDGGIQGFLEKYKVPYIGSTAKVCKKVFDKYVANEAIKALSFFTYPSIVLQIYHNDHKGKIKEFFKKYNIERAVVKPATGGSSIGVFSVKTADEALSKADLLFSKRMDTRVVVEQFAKGKEFTVIILQNKFGLPVALLPTEIETDYTENQIFDFRRKYLPTRQVAYHCPPRFDNRVVEKIQVQAEQLFHVLGMQDFARFDGWVTPEGQIWFSDFNPISGMEQNSFLFQQATRVGFTHTSVLKYILDHACLRYDIKPVVFGPSESTNKKEIAVLFGGSTAERQVSLMSGTNVWLKLRHSEKYLPKPYLLDTSGSIWRLPYALTLNHTVEEIAENCEKAGADEDRLAALEQKVRLRLGLESIPKEDFFIPKKMTLEEFVNAQKFVFNALHGGFGEDGTLQTFLDKSAVLYNGSGVSASKLCMDKFLTGKMVAQLKIDGVFTAGKVLLDIRKMTSLRIVRRTWREACKKFAVKSLIIKPVGDGCSAGVIRLFSVTDLAKYLELVHLGLPAIPKGTFANQEEIIDLPPAKAKTFLLEEFIETDKVAVKNNKLIHRRRSGFVELTVGVISEGKKIRVFNPSLTVAEGEVLSVEEKFQGGTGVNITPPPESIIPKKTTERIKGLVGQFAERIGIEGYARIDLFANIDNGNVVIIEVNTLPGLTPSTVLYHQALAETPPIYPRELLEKLIANKGY